MMKIHPMLSVKNVLIALAMTVVTIFGVFISGTVDEALLDSIQAW